MPDLTSRAACDDAIAKIAAEVVNIDSGYTWLRGVLISEETHIAAIRDIRFPTVPTDTGLALVDCGALVDNAPWTKDAGFSGGTAQAFASSLVVRTLTTSPPVVVLQTYREGNASYTIGSIPAGVIGIEFTFMDPASTAVGQRIFNVTVNGQLYVQNLDLFAVTSVAGRDYQQIVYVTQATLGNVGIGFIASAGLPIVSSIRIFDATGHAVSTPITGGGGGAIAVPNDSYRFRYYSSADPGRTPQGVATSPITTTAEAAPIVKDWGVNGPYPGLSIPWSLDAMGNFPFNGVGSYGTYTFTGTDTTLPTGWISAIESGGAGRGSYGYIKSNVLDLHEVGASGRDGFVNATLATTSPALVDVCMFGEWQTSTLTCHGPSMWLRDAGTYPGPHTGYMIGVEPSTGLTPGGTLNRFTIAKRDGSNTSSDPAGQFTLLTSVPITVAANTWYYWRIEVVGDTINGYLGATPYVDPVTTPWTSTAAGGNTVTAAGNARIFNGDHGFGATSSQKFRNVRVEDMKPNYTADISVDDAGRLFIDGVKVWDSWIQQAPTDYHPVFRIATTGYHEVRWEYNNTSYTGNLHASWREGAVVVGGGGGTPPPPPPAPTPGNLVMGVYEFGTSSWSNHFSSLIQHDVPVAMIYWNLWEDTNNGDFLGGGGGGAWLGARSDRVLVLGVSPMNVVHDWDNTSIASKMAGMASYVNAKAALYGFSTSQLVIRWGYEGNGNWMPWGCGYADGAGNGIDPAQGPGFIRAYRASWNAYHPICPGSPWDWSMTPWESGEISFAGCYPGDSYVDIVGADVYDDYEWGSADQNLATHMVRMTYLFDFADAHGKQKVIDESAVCATGLGNNGAGDNPAFINAMGALALARGLRWWQYFNAAVRPEPASTLADHPNSLNALRAFAAGLG